ncbi:MAG: caspase family protein [Candidatus Thermoplasmatota archaeon]|nr:caspase family protein [Candidatus Thermoplasmatota archaeon]
MRKIKFAIILTTFLLISTPMINYIQGKTIQNTIINSTSENEIKYYAVISGCQRYKNSSYNRLELIDSSKMLYDALLSCKNWNVSNIILLLNENATAQNISNALVEISERVGPNDVFLFSWAGHGTILTDADGDEKEFDPEDKYDEAICPYDYNEYDQVNQTYNKGLRDDELNYYFSKINCKGMFLIFESCFSGGLVSKESLKDKFLNSFKKDFEKINSSDVDAENRVVLMSTPDNKLGYGARLYPFVVSLTYSLAFSINFLNSQIPEEKENLSYFNIYNDGFVSAEELFNPTKSMYKFQSLSFSLGMLYYIRV